jgi:hypothetical protein
MKSQMVWNMRVLGRDAAAWRMAASIAPVRA